MIADNIKNWSSHPTLFKIDKVFDILEDPNTYKLPDGRYEVNDGNGSYFLVQRYSTIFPKDGKLEAHRRFADVQFIGSGAERIGHCKVDKGLEIMQAYNPDKDIIFYKTPSSLFYDLYRERDFGLFLPEDAHMPKIRVVANQTRDVIKVVVKIPADVFKI